MASTGPVSEPPKPTNLRSRWDVSLYGASRDKGLYRGSRFHHSDESDKDHSGEPIYDDPPVITEEDFTHPISAEVDHDVEVRINPTESPSSSNSQPQHNIYRPSRQRNRFSPDQSSKGYQAPPFSDPKIVQRTFRPGMDIVPSYHPDLVESDNGFDEDFDPPIIDGKVKIPTSLIFIGEDGSFVTNPDHTLYRNLSNKIMKRFGRRPESIPMEPTTPSPSLIQALSSDPVQTPKNSGRRDRPPLSDSPSNETADMEDELIRVVKASSLKSNTDALVSFLFPIVLNQIHKGRDIGTITAVIASLLKDRKDNEEIIQQIGSRIRRLAQIRDPPVGTAESPAPTIRKKRHPPLANSPSNRDETDSSSPKISEQIDTPVDSPKEINDPVEPSPKSITDSKSVSLSPLLPISVTPETSIPTPALDLLTTISAETPISVKTEEWTPFFGEMGVGSTDKTTIIGGVLDISVILSETSSIPLILYPFGHTEKRWPFPNDIELTFQAGNHAGKAIGMITEENGYHIAINLFLVDSTRDEIEFKDLNTPIKFHFSHRQSSI